MLKIFNKTFGIEESVEEERNRFVQRINQTLFNQIEDHPYPESYNNIFKILCYQLGLNADDRIREKNQFNYSSSANIPSLRSLTNDDFFQTLEILVLLYQFFNKNKDWQDKISLWIKTAVSNANIDLGVRWSSGMFYPSGAELLDEKLIDEILGILHAEDKKSILVAYQKGLKEFSESNKDKSKLKNVVRDMQLSLDETSKVLLGDKNIGFKHLLKDKNWDEIVKNKFYQKIFFQLNEFADKLAKHKAEAEFDEYEVETFVYLTGIFIRLVFIQK